jgi:hypothetical protein
MRAITIKQPWASLIMSGKKTIELRTWFVFPGVTLAVHAGATWDKRGDHHAGILEFPKSAIIGSVEVTRYEIATPGMHAETGLTLKQHIGLLAKYQHEGKRLYAWHLQNPTPCEPIPCAGKLGLWHTSALGGP